jgi:hypothetical protein
MAASTSRPAQRYGVKDPGTRRLALIPGVIAAIALLVGVTTLYEGAFVVVQWIATIFAGIVGVFAFQARQWWWLPFLAAIAVVWNPVWPVVLDGTVARVLEYLSALVFLLAGWLIRVPIPDEQRRGR